MADKPMPEVEESASEQSPEVLVSEIQEKLATLADLLPDDQRQKLESVMDEVASLGSEPDESEPEMMSSIGGKGVPVGPQMKG